jgi:hypothetical protein
MIGGVVFFLRHPMIAFAVGCLVAGAVRALSEGEGEG